jgi:hypothetical protein
MQLTSNAFSDGSLIPSIYTCEGKGINPPLEFHNIPTNTISLVLLMDDPDVPTSVRADQMWDHWVIFNIPPKTQHLSENTTPPGVQGKNTSGQNKYQGPCPPDREHRYFFKLYALDKMLDLPVGATKKEVEQAMKGHVLAKTQLIGKYEKKRLG